MAFRFEQFLNARSAYGPTVDMSGHRLYFMADMTGVAALWSLPLGEVGAWPEPLVTGLDRVQAAYPSPTPGRLIVAADIGGAERTQLFLIDGPGTSPRRLTDDPTRSTTSAAGTLTERRSRFPRIAAIRTTSTSELLDVSTGERGRSGSPTPPLTPATSPRTADACWCVGRIPRRITTVFVVDVHNGSVTRLTPGGTPAVYENLGWSRDGSASTPSPTSAESIGRW